MIMTREQKDLAETISKSNGGCVLFNMTRASQIAGRSRANFPEWLHKHGITVEKTGKDKYVNVNDLAVAMTSDKVSPL